MRHLTREEVRRILRQFRAEETARQDMSDEYGNCEEGAYHAGVALGIRYAMGVIKGYAEDK